ncbi:MAG: type II toxin-antitoxin system VapC family toxin [Parachlamydiaceae bacterium]
MPILKTLKQHKLLLDTHVWIWLMSGNKKLKADFLKAIEKRTEEESANILVSAISIWEVGMLVEKKRIELNMNTLQWVEEALNSPNISLVPLSPSIAIRSSQLLGEIHGDPADRILTATAYEHHAVLVTHDEKLLEYGKNRQISAYNPC